MKKTYFLRLSVLLLGLALIFTACGKKDSNKNASDDGVEKVEEKVNLKQINSAASDFIYDLNKDGTGIIILNYAGGPGIVNIPDKIDGFSVTEIRGFAFSDFNIEKGEKDDESIKNSIVSISIPDSVTTIGPGAFAYMDSLQTVTLPKGLLSLPLSCFSWCESLSTVKLPEGLKSIENFAFFGCKSLSTIKFSESLKTIGNGAFEDCDSLPKSLELPKALETIGNEAFLNCDSIKSVKLPETITSIGEAAFYNCSELNTISMPSTLLTFGDAAFGLCEKLTIPTRKSIRDKGYNEAKNLEWTTGSGWYKKNHVRTGTFLDTYERYDAKNKD